MNLFYGRTAKRKQNFANAKIIFCYQSSSPEATLPVFYCN